MNAPFQLKPNINYCVTVDDANRAIDEVIRDAQGGRCRRRYRDGTHPGRSRPPRYACAGGLP